VSAIDQPRGRNLGDIVRGLIEEAWRRARRRRLIYGSVALSFAVIGAILVATLRTPAESQGGLPVAIGGPNAQASGFLAGEHVYHGEFDLDGKRGDLHVSLRFGNVSGRTWQVGMPGVVVTPAVFSGSGDYSRVTGRGHGFQVGGHADAWYARVAGVVTHPGKGKQRVVISLKGRPNGTFVITPKQPGFLKRDAGTQKSGWLG
jgi:hypothetical protein